MKHLEPFFKWLIINCQVMKHLETFSALADKGVSYIDLRKLEFRAGEGGCFGSHGDYWPTSQGFVAYMNQGRLEIHGKGLYSKIESPDLCLISDGKPHSVLRDEEHKLPELSKIFSALAGTYETAGLWHVFVSEPESYRERPPELAGIPRIQSPITVVYMLSGFDAIEKACVVVRKDKASDIRNSTLRLKNIPRMGRSPDLPNSKQFYEAISALRGINAQLPNEQRTLEFKFADKI